MLMKRHFVAAIMAVACVFVYSDVVRAASEKKVALFPLSNVATDWLVKSICVDQSNQPVAADPYYECPAGDRRRKIEIAEPLPYHNKNQIGNLISDSFPVLDTNGNKLYFRTFDWGPVFNNFDNNTDGFDVYVVRDAWVSVINTRDAGGFGTTFFGSNCTLGDGWLLFPKQGFLGGGRIIVPIAGVYWEHSGESFPGSCPTRYVTDSQTSWALQRGLEFGGFNGHETKKMDAVISYHGFKGVPAFLEHGHMEVFYFTQQYGLTKWEAWVSARQGAQKTKNCNVPDQVQYKGIPFIIRNCQDFSNVAFEHNPDIPQWPVPEANILSHSHFDRVESSSRLNEWHWDRPEGNLVGMGVSASARDVKFRGPGVRFIALDCSRGESTCGSVYQDLPARSVASGAYLYGVDARTTPGQGVGTLRVSVQQLDRDGKVIRSNSFEGTVGPYNGSHPGTAAEAASVVLSSRFLHAVAPLSIAADAARVRFVIKPLTPQRFEIIDAWLNRWPVSH